jgi:hypothetical protein
LLVIGTDSTLHVVTFPSSGPADAQLEGTASLALFTADGKSVVYAGSDPSGRVGVFEQPATPPLTPPSATSTGVSDGGTP